MTISKFLENLQRLDVQIIAEGDSLRCIAPEGVLTAELRSQITARKTEVLTFLQHQEQNLLAPIKAVARGSVSPLSFAQQRLWFLNQLAPDNPFYNVPTAIRLNGHLDRAALEQSFNEIIRRHEALRTTFAEVDGQPVQIVSPSWSLSFPVMDLQAVPVHDRDAIAQQLVTEESQRPFSLSTAPLLRMMLLQLAETEHILVLTLHHIVADGWSLGVLIRELSTLYTALVQGQTAFLPELPIQYADFAHWQRDWLQGEVLQRQLSYWRSQLHNCSVLNLPSDRPRPPVPSYRGATYPIQLSSRLTIALETLSQQNGTSLFMTLLAAFQTLLYRYTGQDDIAVGSPIANRHRHELEGLIGFFVNSLVMRTDLSGNPTFQEALGRVRDVALNAYAYQDLPFEKLVEELDPDRDVNRNPLFQVGFALQNAPMQPLELPGLTLTPLKFDPGTTRFDLEFHLWERSQGLNHLLQSPSEGLSGFVAYSTDLFDRTTIERIVQHFQTLLEGIVVHPDARLAELPILSSAERQQLLVEWNQTQTEYVRKGCLHRTFEEYVQESPDKIAVVYENQQLTYQDLDRRANQLAQNLQEQGVHPNCLVGLCVDRGLDLVVGILGILKAGGAFVPLDPEYPSDRLQFMLSDAQVSVLLTQSWLMNRLPASQAQIFCLDKDALKDHDREPSLTKSHTEVTAEHLAYVIYTSGSTGTPKGVLISHRGLSNVVSAQQQVFQLPQESRILQFSSLSFDASIFEIAMAFGSGSTLYIASKSDRSPEALVHFLRKNAITHAILPPAMLAVLPKEELPALQTLISGGEACSNEIVDRWAVDRQFFNAYGLTETTIWSTVARLEPSNGKSTNKPTIGRPIANTEIYILDTQLQPVPIEIIGELYIGGDGLALGYLNRPELTAERFIPFSQGENQGESRIYKTGDLARYRADGTIEFLGRGDDQVKIRSFRVELGEIEAALRSAKLQESAQQPVVREAIVIASQVASETDQRLTAYFTLNHENKEYLALEKQLQQHQVEHWKTLYNQTYAPSNERSPFVGWNSSYTEQPIPIKQMEEWVRDRVQRVLALKPKRVLEIGCGTGLLLFQIAPHCTEYWATDFSQVSLDHIQQQLTEPHLSHVKLLHRVATDFEGIDRSTFDVVILNSVVQYFPNVEYLLQVLEGAIQTIASGGVLFVGDVRSLPLLSAFHTWMQFCQADSTLERSQLRHRVQKSIFDESELVVDEAFFYALKNRFSKIRNVEIQLLQSQYHNEMTQFRYNVFLHIDYSDNNSVHQCDNSTIATNNTKIIDWTKNQSSVASIGQTLIDTQPDVLAITNVPNARIISAVTIAKWLMISEAPKTVGRMREALEQVSQLATEEAIDPQEWWALETELPYKLQICWSDSSAEGRYDVIFTRHGVETTFSLPFTEPGDETRPLSTYTNRPLQSQLANQLIPQLRDELKRTLPEYMIPSVFVALKTLPLTINGKVDRRALPLPDEIQPQTSSAYVAPRSPIEETLVNIWTELLRIKQASIHDNFFELGGHSLLATQMVSRVRDAFGVEVLLRSVFEAPTIAQLATVIEALQSNHSQQQAPALVKLDRAAYRRSRSSLGS